MQQEQEQQNSSAFTIPHKSTAEPQGADQNRQKYRIANKRAPGGTVNRKHRSPAQPEAIPHDREIASHTGNYRGAEMGRDAGSHGIRT
jgi:hypothetical protein